MPIVNKSALFLVLVGLGLALASSPVLAQEGEDGAAEEGPKAPIPSSGEELGSGSVENDLSLYWGGRRFLSPVLERNYIKAKRFEGTLFGGIIPNDALNNYIPLGLRLDYHFTDSLAVEVAGSYTLQTDTELKTFLEGNNKQLDSKLDFHVWRANAAIAWSPFYGKLALLQRKLSHFDINLLLGGGVVQTEAPADNNGGELGGGIKPEGMFGMGFRFFVNRDFAVRADYRQYIFPKTNGALALPSEFTLGFSLFTGE